MYTDKLLRVSTDQAITVDAVSTDTIDLSVARDIGEGEELYMHFAVTEAFTAAGAATLTFQVIGSTAANLGSPVVLGSTGPIALTDLALGKRHAVRINPSIASLGYRYLGANYDVATGPMLTGKVTADVVNTIQDGQKFYASGFSVV
jgi:hypothetical protein